MAASDTRGRYIGAVPVASSSLSSTLWSMFGAQVVDTAAKKLKKLNPKPIDVDVRATNYKISITDAESHIHIDNEDIRNVKYASVHPNDKKRFVYIILYPHIGILYCHMVAVKTKALAERAIESIRRCMEASKKRVNAEEDFFGFDGFVSSMTDTAAYSASQDTSDAQQEIVSLVQTTGIAEAIRYVGTVPLRVKGAASGELKDSDVHTAAVYMLDQLRAHVPRSAKRDRRLSFVSRQSAAEADPLAGLPVVLVVSTEGVRTIDNISREETHKVFLQDLVYFAPVSVKHGGSKNDFLASVSRDTRLRHVRLRLYRCNSLGQAEEICQQIRDAFKSANRQDQLRNGRPFMPVASLSTEIVTPLSALEFDREQITPVQPIGAGQFGLVFLCKFSLDGVPVERAVKVLRPGATPDTMADFLREAEILQSLDHGNVVRLHGVCLKQKPWLLLEENVVYGDLDAALHACVDKDIVLTEGELLGVSLQIVLGMVYVASKRVVHGDLAARNCLLHVNNQVKLADFGWSRLVPAGKKAYVREVIPTISTRWLAPECVDKKEFSEKSDVWAAGVTIWECFSYGEVPYSDIHFLQVARVVREGMRLSRPQNCPHSVFGVLEKCWARDATARPRFKDIEKLFLKAGAQPHGFSSRDIGNVLSESPPHVSVDALCENPAPATATARPASECLGFGEDDDADDVLEC
eukprot:m.938596 g.938596  ORF g.938596 m.938596 type:complete len:694 (+) comp23820_c0_seq3:212-2293(+)